MRKIRHGVRHAKVLGLHVGARRSQATPRTDGGRLRTALATCGGMLLALSLGADPRAAPPADIRPDPELELWFKSLRQPTTGRPCCSISNCRFRDFRVRDGRYEVEIDGARRGRDARDRESDWQGGRMLYVQRIPAATSAWNRISWPTTHQRGALLYPAAPAIVRLCRPPDGGLAGHRPDPQCGGCVRAVRCCQGRRRGIEA